MRAQGTVDPARIGGRAAAIGAGIDGRAAGVKHAGGQPGLPPGGSAVIGRRPQHWIRVEITGIVESAAAAVP